MLHIEYRIYLPLCTESLAKNKETAFTYNSLSLYIIIYITYNNSISNYMTVKGHSHQRWKDNYSDNYNYNVLIIVVILWSQL